MNLQKIIEVAMKKHSFKSYREMARNLNINHMSLMNWLDGSSIPKDENIIDIAKLAGEDQYKLLAYVHYLRSVGTPAESYCKKIYEAVTSVKSDPNNSAYFILCKMNLYKNERKPSLSNIFISKTNILMAQAYA